jgi:hypothetical protein
LSEGSVDAGEADREEGEEKKGTKGSWMRKGTGKGSERSDAFKGAPD